MFIQTAETPNPATIKFLPGQIILEKGTMDFQTLEAANEAPLAQRLFTLQGVRAVFFGQDFVSVTKDEDTDWSMLKSMVMALLMEHLSTGQPIVSESAKKPLVPVMRMKKMTRLSRRLKNYWKRVYAQLWRWMAGILSLKILPTA